MEMTRRDFLAGASAFAALLGLQVVEDGNQDRLRDSPKPRRLLGLRVFANRPGSENPIPVRICRKDGCVLLYFLVAPAMGMMETFSPECQIIFPTGSANVKCEGSALVQLLYNDRLEVWQNSQKVALVRVEREA